MRRHKKSLLVKCNWPSCEEKIEGSAAFHAHQIAHFLDLLAGASRSASINCGICQSDLADLELESALRHIHFHSWVTCLLAVGQQLQSSSNWPRCYLPPIETVVPLFPTPFECSWQGCIFWTNNVAQLYQHVSLHPKEYTERRQSPLHKLKCQWENCTYRCTRITNLTYHLRIHTQEKVIGCPDCGILFTAANKLRDHLFRQLPSRLKDNQTDSCDEQIPTYKCPRCFRIFGSQAVLQMHINQHVNKIKCPHCDMTLHGNHAVRRHILFRHSTERPVECPHCDRRFKDHGCLESHISWRHKDQLGHSPEGAERQAGVHEPVETKPTSSGINIYCCRSVENSHGKIQRIFGECTPASDQLSQGLHIYTFTGLSEVHGQLQKLNRVRHFMQVEGGEEGGHEDLHMNDFLLDNYISGSTGAGRTVM